MALNSYTSLQDSIVTWAWKTGDAEFTEAVPDFIALLEDALNNGGEGIDSLRVREMEADDSIVLTDGVGTLPDDYLEYRTVRYGTQNYDFPASDWDVVGGTIVTTRTGVSPLALGYYRKIPALADNDTNWLLQKAPSIYLYGSLIHAAPFMREDARVQTWDALFRRAVNGLVSSDVRARYARGTVRTDGYTP